MASETSAERVLRLLVALDEIGPLRVREAADLLGVTDSTAHRLLSTLRESGLAVQDASRVYHPAPDRRRVHATEGQIVAAAAPHASALNAQTAETVHITCLEGRGTRFILERPSPHVLRVGRRLGMVLPAHVTAGGLVMLAGLSEDRLSMLYPRIPLMPEAQPDLRQLRRTLVTVRRRGFAVNAERTEPGVNTIGVPVRDSSGLPSLALVIAAPRTRFTAGSLVDFVPALMATAHAIEAAIESLPALSS